jgi:hypothetical protein
MRQSSRNQSGVQARSPQTCKAFERGHFFIREKVEEDMIEVPYVRTVENLADFFTKPLPNDVFFRMRDAIMNCGRHSPIPKSQTARRWMSASCTRVLVWGGVVERAIPLS